ncbi:MAG: type I methionyl aminopeptidase [Acidobacteriota bacterium]
MTIESEHQLDRLKEIGSVVRSALDAMSREVRPGITTAELDAIGARILERAGARSAPAVEYGFPASICISVNDQVVHGLPGDRKVARGDLVKLDVTAEKGGYLADAAITVSVPPVDPEHLRLAACAERAFRRAMGVARAGQAIRRIGRAVEQEVRRSGFSVIKELSGHGIGRAIHEPPSVPNYHARHLRQKLHPGLVITVEPTVSMGSGKIVEDRDGWTIRTADGAMASHHEHTLVITRGAPILLTAA